MATVSQTTYLTGQGIATFWANIRLSLAAFSAGLIFLFLVVNIPGLKLQTGYGEYFIPLVVTAFLVSAVIATKIQFNMLIGLLFVGSIVGPLLQVTATGSYNVITTGLMFGALFRIRPSEIHLNKSHLILFAGLLIAGAYYNFVPLILDNGVGFHWRLWLYNFATFLKYIFIGLLVAQSTLKLERFLKIVNWFSILYAGIVVLEAFHIPPVNMVLKMFSFMGQRPYEVVEIYALGYFRAAGTAYDANHAGTHLAILLVIALYQRQRFPGSPWQIPLILLAIFLTGSRAGAGLAIVAALIWLMVDHVDTDKLRKILKYAFVAIVLLGIGLTNDSFAKTAETATGRYIVAATPGESDTSISLRSSEILEPEITIFGDPTESHYYVHSLIARTILFYGVVGLVVTAVFWAFYFRLVRRSYLGVGLVAVLAMTGFVRWTFHIEAYFIPVVIVTVLQLREHQAIQPER